MAARLISSLSRVASVAAVALIAEQLTLAPAEAQEISRQTADGQSLAEAYTDYRAVASDMEQESAAQTPSGSAELIVSGATESADERLLDFSRCLGPPDPAGPTENFLEELARHVAHVENRLQAYGFASAVLQQSLRTYEQSMLGIASAVTKETIRNPGTTKDLYHRLGAIESKLFRRLDQQRRRIQRNLPRIRYGVAYCSMRSGSRYIFRWMPPNGRVWIASEFRFRVCARRVRNPWNVDTCSSWREIHRNQTNRLLGRHRYQVRWPDGSERRGDRTFDDFFDFETITVDLGRN